MIEPVPPESWKQLQAMCASLFQEIGLKAETEKVLELPRGKVEIDVYAEDQSAILPSVCIVECKNWKRKVPKNVVHAFRTVVGECGATHGFIISAIGFQAGAKDAASYTNVRLFSWTEFEAFIEPIWTERYFRPKLYEEIAPLVDYTEPINSRVFRKADSLSEHQQKQFLLLRKKYEALAMMGLLLVTPLLRPYLRHETIERMSGKIMLPFDETCDKAYSSGMPEDVCKEKTARGFLTKYTAVIRAALSEFDEVFGERA